MVLDEFAHGDLSDVSLAMLLCLSPPSRASPKLLRPPKIYKVVNRTGLIKGGTGEWMKQRTLESWCTIRACGQGNESEVDECRWPILNE
jgi:hypothetical protein